VAVLPVAMGGGSGSATCDLVGDWFANRPLWSRVSVWDVVINVEAVSFIIEVFLAFAQERISHSPHWRLFFRRRSCQWLHNVFDF